MTLSKGLYQSKPVAASPQNDSGSLIERWYISSYLSAVPARLEPNLANKSLGFISRYVWLLELHIRRRIVADNIDLVPDRESSDSRSDPES